AWNYIHGRMKEHDKAMIEGHTGDIDSLLIFAGLFSAVLTAFLVETYSQLQIDTGQVTVQILLDISQQLHNVSEGQVALPTNATATINHFAPDPSVVVINCLWFLSLIAALCSALLGIIVKQWLREYSLWTTIAPVEHAVHLR
ncbi:hypothetical protein PUNSTDRAFT_29631, partial [Punctularia strigosozonata HHB-11173 SS5]|uniref:uncharacterized protein n=1 Tax=Punctularia strigosozonata (strain HHB-11173) TaxID=741275 RepID=UPI0004417A0C